MPERSRMHDKENNVWHPIAEALCEKTLLYYNVYIRIQYICEVTLRKVYNTYVKLYTSNIQYLCEVIYINTNIQYVKNKNCVRLYTSIIQYIIK